MSSENDNDNKQNEPNTAESIPAKAQESTAAEDVSNPEEIAKALEASLTNPPVVAKDAKLAVAEEVKPLPKRKTLSIIIHDAGVLRAAYMQFIKGGGLFIPTKKSFKMGEDTNLVIRLLDEEDPYRVSGKVVWITPVNTTSSRAAGIGVEFAEDKNGERLRSRIEIILGPHLKSQESTHTM